MTTGQDSFWGRLGTAEQKAIEATSSRRGYRPGEYLCHEGEESNHVIIMMGGSVRVLSHSIDDRAVVIGVRTAGDINRACRQPAGTYTWECGKKEFYAGEYNGDNTETAMGSVAVVPGAERMPATVTDPLTNGTAGVGWFDRTNGSMQNDKHTNGLQVTGDAREGLGDLEALCDLAPVQVGNRVWVDENTNGVEDGDESPLAGVKVTATPCLGGTALAPKTTDSKGEYAFTTADGLKPDTCYNLKFDYTNADTSAIPGEPPGSSLKWTAKTADSKVDPNTGLATVTVGPAGSVDNSVDAGVVAYLSSASSSYPIGLDDPPWDPARDEAPGIEVITVDVEVVDEVPYALDGTLDTTHLTSHPATTHRITIKVPLPPPSSLSPSQCPQWTDMEVKVAQVVDVGLRDVDGEGLDLGVFAAHGDSLA
ncbi:SdrD B-like domain-containing protein [Kibdelosporangium lantanae]|uniref:SdrD B-like domain-containing protein n=1 Tax=Kibdelosporangium lantanae TaxID=1497396 RepID=A0ABW3M5R7_9PSEU